MFGCAILRILSHRLTDEKWINYTSLEFGLVILTIQNSAKNLSNKDVDAFITSMKQSGRHLEMTRCRGQEIRGQEARQRWRRQEAAMRRCVALVSDTNACLSGLWGCSSIQGGWWPVLSYNAGIPRSSGLRYIG